MFYEPSCYMTRELIPIWDQLSGAFNDDQQIPVVFARVNCEKNVRFCLKMSIEGSPTLKFFKLGMNKSVDYENGSNMPQLIAFIYEQLNVVPKVGPVCPTITDGLAELTAYNMAKYVQKGNFFVFFYLKNCTFCGLEQVVMLAEALKDNSSVSIAQLDCAFYNPVCMKLKIRSIPAVIWIEDGRVIETFVGSKTNENYLAFIQDMLKYKGTEPYNKDTIITLDPKNFYPLPPGRVHSSSSAECEK